MLRVLFVVFVLGVSADFASAQSFGSTQAYVVQVVDSQEAPIADAFVEPASLSIDGEPVRTDKQGRATIPRNLAGSFGQPTVWIMVSKPGYQTTGHLKLPKVWPMKVTLQPAKPDRN